MIKAATVAASLFLAGCTAPGAVSQAEVVVDQVMLLNRAAICDGHFPLRAYVKLYGRSWDDLVAFCGWGKAPPAIVLGS